MMTDWKGIFPAMTTSFTDDYQIDQAAMEQRIEGQIEAGVDGLVMCGSLGENGALSAAEKQDILKIAVSVSNGRVPVLMSVAETTTAQACTCAEKAVATGADGLMVLPGMQYVSDPRETVQHMRTVAAATELPIMIYNNPVAYGTDITPEAFAELADEERFVALKESSADVRRLSEIIKLTGDRYRLFVGVDNLALESFMLGADGWVAGLVNALPNETVVLFQLAKQGRYDEARQLYRWFLPLLDLDVDSKFIHYIKLVGSKVDVCTETVRPPRLPLAGEERAAVEGIIAEALANRPELPKI